MYLKSTGAESITLNSDDVAGCQVQDEIINEKRLSKLMLMWLGDEGH